MSGFCKNASFLRGLKSPEDFKLFSTTEDISSPIFSFFNKFWNSLTDFDSTNKGDTAIGSGFKLPLVMSTSINPNEVFGIN